MKLTGVARIKGSKIEDYWKTVKESESVSVKKCVFIFVVPENQWETSRFFVESECWLTGVSDVFLSVCGVGVIAIATPQS